MIKFKILILIFFVPLITLGQSYDYSYASDRVCFYGSMAFCFGSYIYKYARDPVRITDASAINIDNLWAFERNAVDQNSATAGTLTHYSLYASIAMPLVLIGSTQRIRSQYPNIILMGLQGFFIENGMTQYIKNMSGRYRPFLYRDDPTVFSRSLPRSASESFISGHTANAAYLTFFGAKIFSDIYPDSRFKPVVWTAAAALPLVTGYLRYKAGKHFPTDILSGYVLGGLLGWAIPAIYRADHVRLNVVGDAVGIIVFF